MMPVTGVNLYCLKAFAISTTVKKKKRRSSEAYAEAKAQPS